MRNPIMLATFVLSLAGCTEQSFFIDDESRAGLSPGSVLGRVCDPSGRTWLPDAMAYTHLIDHKGKLYDTRIAYTDRDGFYLLEDLPAKKDYVIYLQFGDEVLSQERVYVDDGQDVALDEPDCFDPLELDVAVITGDYDDFQDVLSNMGFANYQLVDGLFAEEMSAFLMNLDEMLKYDIIVFNGGVVEEGVIYLRDDLDVEPGEEGAEEEGEEEDEEVVEDDEEVVEDDEGVGGDTGGEEIEEPVEEDTGPTIDPSIILQNIREYVLLGGAVYASDWAYDVIELCWPTAVNFVGADEIPNSAQLGEYGIINAAVSDAALAEWLGTDYTQVEFDLPVWPPIEGVAETVSVHLTGNVDYREGTTTYTLTAVPLLVSFTSGDGKVAFSTFRVAKNADADVMLMLQYMMYQL